MTISPMSPPAAAAMLDKLLADAGVAGAHGFEVLRLVRLVDNGYDRVLNDATRDGLVTAPRWRILVRLWLEEQMGCAAVNPTHLSRTQHVSKNTISDHLRALEEAGLIERELDRHDRRQFKIRLTDAGRASMRAATPEYARLLNRVLALFTTQEIDQLQMLLGKLHGALCAGAGDASCGVSLAGSEGRTVAHTATEAAAP